MVQGYGTNTSRYFEVKQEKKLNSIVNIYRVFTLLPRVYSW